MRGAAHLPLDGPTNESSEMKAVRRLFSCFRGNRRSFWPPPRFVPWCMLPPCGRLAAALRPVRVTCPQSFHQSEFGKRTCHDKPVRYPAVLRLPLVQRLGRHAEVAGDVFRRATGLHLLHRSDDLRLGVLALISSERLLCTVVWSFPTYDWLRLPGAGQKDFGTPDHPALGDGGIEKSGETWSLCNRSAQTVLRPMDTCVKDGSAHSESK